METIGVRELRQNASDYLRRVEAGETIEVTNRGRPVARLVPVKRSRLAQLEAEGRITKAKGNFHDFPPPLPLPEGAVPASEMLRRMREHER